MPIFSNRTIAQMLQFIGQMIGADDVCLGPLVMARSRSTGSACP